MSQQHDHLVPVDLIDELTSTPYEEEPEREPTGPKVAEEQARIRKRNRYNTTLANRAVRDAVQFFSSDMAEDARKHQQFSVLVEVFEDEGHPDIAAMYKRAADAYRARYIAGRTALLILSEEQ